MSSNEPNEQPPADITNLQESFSKQQKKISALKELVRKSEVAHGKSTSSAQEKVKNIAQRLTLLKSKARSRQSLAEPQQNATTAEGEATEQSLSQSHISITSPNSSNFSTPNPTPLKPQSRSDSSTLLAVNAVSSPTPSSEKIILLRQQMQQNKALMAQRASSKQHLEQLVTQLKEKFDSTQQCLEDTTELGKSMTNLSALAYTPVTRERHKSATDLSTQPFSLEKERIKFLENRCRLLEKQLEKEKQANNNPDASLNESISSQASSKRIKELENKVLELEESLKEQQKVGTEMERLQNEIAEKDVEINRLRQKLNERTSENYEANQLEAENERLLNEIAQHLKRITELQTVNDVLETTRCDLTEKNNKSEEQLQQLQAELDTSIERLQNTRDELEQSEVSCASLQEDLDKFKFATEAITPDNTADSTDAQVNAEMAKQIKELQDEMEGLKAENLQLKAAISKSEKLEISDANIADKIAALEATIESQRTDLEARTETLLKQEDKLMEKTIELNVLNANFKVMEEKLQISSKNKPLFSSSGGDEADNPELREEIKQLKLKLDESNKAMIKLKLKCKQTEKKMEKLRKASDLHLEVVKLEKINEELQQKITVLEDEKGQWQLTHVDDTKNSDSTEKSMAAINSQLEEQCKTHTETIRLLEQQKYEQSEKLEATQYELQTMKEQLNRQDRRETARVKSEMSEIRFEEEVKEQAEELQALQARLLTKEMEIEELQQKQEALQTEKQVANKKLEHYINENIELLDKVEKLSKSSSSAESIEIVERLTQQERAELEEFNKRLDQEHIAEHATSSVSELTQTEMGPELSESLVKLREESSELMNKIELFTTERREVLEKMEHLTTENQDLLRKMEELAEQKDIMETNALLAENAKSKLETKLQEVTREKESLASQVTEYTAQQVKLSQELTSLQKSSEVVAAIDSAEGATLFDKCEKSLSKLNSELEAYRKANDKNAKFNASKKLAKEAKNAYTQLSELLQKVKEASTAVETVTVVETVVAVTAPNGKALAEYEQLTAQNRELKTTVDELRRDLQEAREIAHESIVEITEIPLVEREQDVESEQQLRGALQEINNYEKQCTELQSTVDDLRRELREALLSAEERTNEVTQLNEELTALRKLSMDFDLVMNDKEMAFEKQIVQLTHLRKQLEGKCETYEGEMEILQTLVTEQKQQLIEAYKESEHDMNMKLLDLQQRDKEIAQLRAEIAQLGAASAAVGQKMSIDLQEECEKLREKLQINKALVTEQINELSNKQETIDTLNQQLIDLYKTMEENANKVIEKEDEIAYLQELMDTNNKEVENLRKDNNAQKSVVDKLLNELHSHRSSLPQFEADVQRLSQTNKQLEQRNTELEQRNKDQLDKLKKYAANLKKRAAQCQEFEAKIKQLEKGALEALQSKEQTKSSEGGLETLKANNLVLNERVNELESKLKETETTLQEVQEALQGKTMELLEALERGAKLESELHETQQNLDHKSQGIVQLKNALSASQEQESGWGSTANATYPELLNEVQEKLSAFAKLEADLQRSEDSLSLKLNENAELRNQLTAMQEQVSDWGTDSCANVNYERLTKELADKTACLEQAERDLSYVQAELQQMHESEKERQQAIGEMQEALQYKHELVTEMEKQLAANMLEQQGVDQTMQERLQAQEQRLSEVSEELKGKSLKFEKSKAVIKERNNQIHRLQAQLKDLQDKLSAQPEEEPFEAVVTAVQTKLNASLPTTAHLQVAKSEYDALQEAHEKLCEQYSSEKSNFQETIARLETLHDGIQAKLQEDLSYIETLEQENAKYKDKICKLEECVGVFEERRASMEKRANLLDEQLQSRANEYEKTEDELIYRLNMLSEHDDVIGRRLLESQEEKEDLLERLDRLQVEFNDLTAKYVKLEKNYETYQEDSNSSLEAEKLTLREQLTATELELQRMCSMYDAKLAAKSTEIDELECELSDQLENINTEKRNLSEDLERARDECTALKDEIVRINESLTAVEQAKQELDREATWLRMQNEGAQQDQFELQELRMQTLQDKTELDNLRHQIETLATNHEMELQALRTQIAELDTLRMQVGQNQTDDQVFIETENKRLTDLLVEKEAVIENYQRQNLQLQMASATEAAEAQPQTRLNQGDPFGLVFNMPPSPSPQTNIQYQNEERERLERNLTERSELAARLQRDINALQNDFHTLREGNAELQRQLAEKSRELESVRYAPSSSSIGAPPLACDVIPAPAMFFASEQMTPSPFDELLQVRTVDRLEGAALGRERHELDTNAINSAEQPTIEDLQRNVSDLEKHAQDLENKLAMRNQRAGEYEQRLREAETGVKEREQQLQQSQLELRALHQQNILQRQTQAATEQNMAELQAKLKNLEEWLQQREQQLADVQAKLQQQTAQAQVPEVNPTQTDALNRLQELQRNLEQLQRLLEERDQELHKVRRALDAEKHLKEATSVLESQIISEPVVKTVTDGSAQAAQVQPTLDMFFGSSTASDFENLVLPQESSIPVVEEEIVPKKAYLCYPTDEPAQNIPNPKSVFDLGVGLDDPFGSNAAEAEAAHFSNNQGDSGRQSLAPREQQLGIQLSYPTDEPAQNIPNPKSVFDLGVGWDDPFGSNEAEAEAAYFSSNQGAGVIGRQSLVPREQQLEIQLLEAAERVQELELALQRTEQQKRELQVKSGKMVKKLKEYKVKTDELQANLNTQPFRKSTSVESNAMFSELDAAIQEELKAQIQSLEARLEEEHKLQESSTAEKEKLLKRIDVLTAGNERMYEMKERQDMDVQMYQARIRELQEKLSKLDDWGTDSTEPAIEAAQQNEATTTVSHKHAEESVEPQLKQKLTELTAEIEDINGDRQELQALLEEEKANVARSDETIRTLLEKIAVLDNAVDASEIFEKSKYNDLKLEHNSLQEVHHKLTDTNDRLTKELRTKQSENENQLQQLRDQITATQTELQLSESKIQELEGEIKKLRREANNSEEDYTDCQLQAFELRTRNYELSEDKKELETDVAMNATKSNLEAQLETICRENEELRIERDVMAKEICNLEAEINRLQSTQEAESIIQEQQTEITKLRKEVKSGDDSYTDCQMQAFDLRTRNFELSEANRELEAGVADDGANQSSLERSLEAMSREIVRLRTEKEALAKQTSDMPTTVPAADSDELSLKLQEKESEIVHLKRRVEDLVREDQTEKLVLEILSKNQEIHLLKMQVKHLEDDKRELEHNLTLQITKEMQAAGKDEVETKISELLLQVQKLEAQLRESHGERAHMEEELKVLNNHVMQSLEQEDKMKRTVLELDVKNIEIAELRKSLEAVKVSGGSAAQVDVTALNTQWEAIVEQRCGEIAQMWREHLEQREVEFKQHEARLQAQIVALQAATAGASTSLTAQQAAASAETTATSTPASVSTSASVSSSAAPSQDGTPLRASLNSEAIAQSEAAADAIIEKMQAALESQEMEIVTLKEQLAIRSAEYARLAAQYDPFKLQTTLSHSGMSVVSGPASLDSPHAKRSSSTSDASVVPKSELDLALYMLHQRDMRLEEMTLELLSLLEERDTLQLKLSNSLRQLEDVRAQAGYVDTLSAHPTIASSDGASVGATLYSPLDSPAKALVAGTTAGDSTAELNQKLSQLQTVDHSKDKVIKEERDQRIRQMERIQQDVAKMPSAAVCELVGSDLSQSSQSPSSVLLNWLWGNTPQNPPAGGAPPN